MTIQSLKNDGFKVFVTHKRVSSTTGEMQSYQSFRSHGMANLIAPKGGLTCVELQKDGKTFQASAKCSKKDAYNRKIGVRICLGRLSSQVLAASNK